METPIAKARATALPLPLEPVSNLPRPRLESAPAPRAKVRVYRSPALRPEEWLDIVAKGRRG